MTTLHNPVLLSEVIATLNPQRGESYLDLTAGYAGHASSILAATQNHKGATLVDRDEYAVEFLRAKYQGDEAPEILHRDFYGATLLQIECGKTYDMILADFGVSSPQLDNAERGFSFSKDGPLDMRMDRSQKLSAETIVNRWGMSDLVEIFEKYGEMSPGFARKVAREIVLHRPFHGTLELAERIKGNTRHSKVHPATKAFQAIRIVVNDELGEIERTLPLLPKLLNPGGRVAIITFHSLEDRLVKDYFKEASSLGEESELEIVNKTPIVAGSEELVINPRARSAKLRVATKKVHLSDFPRSLAK
ncbi:16S rRNA (cytosine(1402)-N(4))-methyltransferase RsmH [Candidatus Saccharibacteria bacterium]|nr:16S rRNA (cytosine(1402)-N(4))-methyltransferase RsmH [Candidatus Saccharibacteria bacterium]